MADVQAQKHLLFRMQITAIAWFNSRETGVLNKIIIWKAQGVPQ